MVKNTNEKALGGNRGQVRNALTKKLIYIVVHYLRKIKEENYELQDFKQI